MNDVLARFVLMVVAVPDVSDDEGEKVAVDARGMVVRVSDLVPVLALPMVPPEPVNEPLAVTDFVPSALCAMVAVRLSSVKYWLPEKS